MKEYKVKVTNPETEWFNLNGEHHREDGPAVEYTNGDKYWFINGKLHRGDGPATEFANGDKYWYINGQYHRETGPAIELVDGTSSWYINGKRLYQNYTQRKYQNHNIGY